MILVDVVGVTQYIGHVVDIRFVEKTGHYIALVKYLDKEEKVYLIERRMDQIIFTNI